MMRGYVWISVALALLAVALSVFWNPESMGLPAWTTKVAAAFLILASLGVYRSGCKRCA